MPPAARALDALHRSFTSARLASARASSSAFNSWRE